MANEISVQISLQIKKGNLTFRSNPTAFIADMDGNPAAPSPGRVVATVDGVDIDTSQVTTPGWGWFRNLDNTNYVAIGPYNPDQSEFYPLFYLGPGQHFAAPLHPHINQEYAGTGTGTTGQLNTFRVQSENADCEMEVYIFER